MIRILYVIPKMEVGGTERHLYNLLHGLDKSRFLPRVICTWKLGRIGRKLREEGYTIEKLGFHKGYDPRIALKLGRIMAEWKPHILHTYLFGFHLLPGIPARWRKVPLTISSRREIGEWKKFYHWWITRAGNWFTDYTVACSQEVKRYTIKKEGLPEERIEVIYNGINLEDFSFQALSNKRKKKVGVIANFYPEKGQRFFLEAVPHIKREFPETEFILAGEGEKRKAMENLCKEMGIDGMVKFLGLCEDIPAILSSLQVLVIPSVREGLPNVLLEALSTGTPVVATRVGGIPEVIRQGEEGILIPPGDPMSIKQAVCFLLSHPEKAREMGRKGRKLAENRFSLQRMLQDYEGMYLSLLSKKQHLGREEIA
ncbi:MAG: glycosyltransferase [Caldiserica bacterium]|nr:glycosyltransferase [Caldisericota bacterium]